MACKYCNGTPYILTTRNDFGDCNICPEDSYGFPDCTECSHCRTDEISLEIYKSGFRDAFAVINIKSLFPSKHKPDEDIMFHTSSERIQIHFCPFCGHQF